MNVDFKRLLQTLTPTFLRKVFFISVLKAISIALQYCFISVKDYFKDLNYHVRVTPQTFSLEKMLNDKLGKILTKPAYIKFPDPGIPFYFSDNGNPAMQYFSNGEHFLFGRSVYLFDFIVCLPKNIESENMTNYVSALLNKYKLISKTFKIEYV